ncbi:DUF5701 family protein [Streptomyces catenulae]|uniref:DUF5701 family protein n=1 Tax=Streptomyces catenulae TaxID=66875 RepID=A0ABV2Z520_9ACTN|nr:DUF5701 family protein [Streptomyces catenulae]
MTEQAVAEVRETFDAGAEFDRQLAQLITLGYPESAGQDADGFRARVAPLRERAVAEASAGPGPEGGRVPFVLVVPRALVPVEAAMARTTLSGGREPGFVDGSFEPGALERFVSTARTGAPEQAVYLLYDVERGEEFCGAVPRDALETLEERGRTPLTVEEGVALLTQHPQLLVKNKCFSLGGSRSGDRRVPALWISRRAPKLGWCWEGNPHTWLGMASAGARRTAG